MRAVLFRERAGKQASRNFRKTLSLLRLRSGAKFEKTSLSTGVCDVFYSFWMPVLLWITKESVGAALTVRKRGPAGKNPIAVGNFNGILRVTVKVLNSYDVIKILCGKAG